jgi:hypothetical protein
MENFSTTYLSVIVLVIGEVLKATGINVGSEALTTTILTLIQVVSAVMILVERFKKGGITAFGAKIKNA